MRAKKIGIVVRVSTIVAVVLRLYCVYSRRISSSSSSSSSSSNIIIIIKLQDFLAVCSWF